MSYPSGHTYATLFLLLVFATVVTLIAAAALVMRGRVGRAGCLLRRWLLSAVVYLAIVIVASAVRPRRELRIGDARCFDDWCLAVVDVTHNASGIRDVVFRLSNRAKRTPMGEKGTVVYLLDARGHRYDPIRDPAAAGFDTKLRPGQSIETTRRFALPREVPPPLGVVYTHEGGFPIGWLIIGEGAARPVRLWWSSLKV